MRRGLKNRWAYDRSPQGDGIVTDPKLHNTRNYHSVEELAARNKPRESERTIATLRKYGWL